jgi:hypothetical protein
MPLALHIESGVGEKTFGLSLDFGAKRRRVLPSDVLDGDVESLRKRELQAAQIKPAG